MVATALAHRCNDVFLMAAKLANLRLSYVFGAGHNAAFDPTHGVDCSSGVSILLRAGGLLANPRAVLPYNTELLESWGVAGAGELITVAVEDTTAPPKGNFHHCAIRFNVQAAHDHGLNWNLALASDGWWQAANASRPAGHQVGWINLGPTAGFNLRHKAGT